MILLAGMDYPEGYKFQSIAIISGGNAPVAPHGSIDWAQLLVRYLDQDHIGANATDSL